MNLRNIWNTIATYIVYGAVGLLWFSVYYAFCEGLPHFDTFMITTMLILLVMAVKSVDEEEEEEETAK